MNRDELNIRIKQSELNIVSLRDQLNRVDDVKNKEILEKELSNLNKLKELFNSLGTIDVLGDELL